MPMREFYGECFKRACRGRLLHVEGISGLLSLLAIPAATHFEIGTKVGAEFMNWLPFYIFAAIFVGTIAFGFLTAPYWIANEVETQRDGLLSTLDTSKKRQEALDELWKLRASGISLRNEDPGRDTDVPEWKARYDVWHRETLQSAEIVSVNLKNWLDRLDQTRTPPQSTPPRSQDHAQTVRIMSEMLQRMETFLTRELR